MANVLTSKSLGAPDIERVVRDGKIDPQMLMSVLRFFLAEADMNRRQTYNDANSINTQVVYLDEIVQSVTVVGDGGITYINGGSIQTGTVDADIFTSDYTYTKNLHVGDIVVDESGNYVSGSGLYADTSGRVVVNNIEIVGLEGGGIETYYSSTAPGSANTGDLWYDTSNFRLNRYNGSSWTAVSDVTQYKTSYATSYVGSVPAANVAGWAYPGETTKIDGGVLKTGTVQADTVISTWIYAGKIAAAQILAGELNTGVLYTGELTANQITTGTLDCGTLTVTNLNASSITVGILSVDRIASGSLGTVKIADNAINEVYDYKALGANIAGRPLNYIRNNPSNLSGTWMDLTDIGYTNNTTSNRVLKTYHAYVTSTSYSVVDGQTGSGASPFYIYSTGTSGIIYIGRNDQNFDIGSSITGKILVIRHDDSGTTQLLTNSILQSGDIIILPSMIGSITTASYLGYTCTKITLNCNVKTSEYWLEFPTTFHAFTISDFDYGKLDSKNIFLYASCHTPVAVMDTVADTNQEIIITSANANTTSTYAIMAIDKRMWKVKK